MTGISAILAGDSAVVVAPPPPPLSVSLTFTGGAGPFHVSGASGDMYTQLGYVYGVIISGGVPPYTSTFTLENDPSGKLYLTAAPGDIGNHTTLAWSGFSVNETEGCDVVLGVTDSVGTTGSSRAPAIGSLIIQRTS